MKQNSIISNKIIILTLLTLIFTLLSVSYVTAAVDWGNFKVFSGTTAPYAANGPGCKGFGGGGQQMSIGQGCPSNNPAYDLGAVWADMDSTYLAWKIMTLNLTNAGICGGSQNSSTPGANQWGVTIEFNADSNTSTGCRMPNQTFFGDMCFPGSEYRLYLYGDNTTKFEIYNRSLNTCANESLSFDNKTCFMLGNVSIDVKYNLTYNITCFGNMPNIKLAINRSAISNLVGLTFQTNTFGGNSMGPVDMLGGFSQNNFNNQTGSGGFADNIMRGGTGDMMFQTQHPCRTITSQSNCTSTSNVSSQTYNCFWDSFPNTCNPDFRNGLVGGGVGMTCSDFCGACTTSANCTAGGNGKCKIVTAPTFLPPGITAFETNKMCVEDRNNFVQDGSCDDRCNGCYNEIQCNNSKYPNPIGSGSGCKWVTDTQFQRSWCDLSTASYDFSCSASNLQKCLNMTGCIVVLGNWSSTLNVCYNSSNTTEGLCFDGIDNDFNNRIDCADTACSKDSACGGNINLLTGGFGTLDPFEALKKSMFENMDPSPPVRIGFGTINNSLPPVIDITGLDAKDMGGAIGIGVGVVNLSPSLLCGGTNASSYYYFLDSDNNLSTGCTAIVGGVSKLGFDYRFEYLIANNGTGGSQEIRRGFRCLNSNFTLYQAKLAGAPTLSQFGNLNPSCANNVVILAIDKIDIANPKGTLRFIVGSSDNDTNVSLANDTLLGPSDNGVYYTSGTIDFKPKDCLENPQACGTAFTLIGGGRFMPFEDCFPSSGDEDMDGLTNCADADCQMAPWCANQYNLSADTTAPTVLSNKANPQNNFVFLQWITNEPTNTTITFHSSCSNSTARYTIHDVGSPLFTFDDFRPWHDLGVRNGDLDNLGTAISLSSSQTYYYKQRVCDKAGNCATSGCLNFTTAGSASPVQYKFDYIPQNNSFLADTTLKIWNGSNFINITPGSTSNTSAGGFTNSTLRFNNPISNWVIDLEGIDLAKAANLNLTDSFNVTNLSGKTYVGMSGSKYNELVQSTGAESILITLPQGNNRLQKCNENNLSDCSDVTAQATRTAGGTGFDNTTWRIPTSLGFSVYTGGDNTTYNITFVNLNTSQTVNATTNATYIINLTNGETTNRTYNISASTTPTGTTSLINGSLVFSVNITNQSSVVVILTVNGSTTGVFLTEVVATLSNDSTIKLNSTSDLGSPIITRIDASGPSIYLNTVNNSWTNNNQSSFSFNFTDVFSSNASCMLFINNIVYNVSVNTTNNTATTISPNVSIANGANVWYVNCTDLYANTNQSLIYTRNIDTTNATVNLLSPVNNAWNKNATPVFTFNYSDTLSPNASCTLYLNGTSYGTNTSVSNNTNTAITANTSLTTGYYNWEVNCTDLTTNVGNSSVQTVKVDVTTPVSTINSVNGQTTSPAGTTNVTLTINFTATDTNIQNWTLSIYNSSFALLVNWTENNSNTSSAVTYTTGANVTYYVNLTTVDNATNSNTTSFTIYVDNTNPLINSLAVSSATLTGGTLTVNSTDALSGIASCNYSGAGSSNLTLSSGLYTATLSGLTASTSYTVNVTCIDLAANRQSNTTTFTTSAAASSSSSSSSSSGGTTGSAGGITTGVAGQFEKKVWSSINKDETATVSLKDGILGITSIDFTMKNTVWGAWVQVNKRTTLPSTITPQTSNVYSYVEITRSSTLTDNTFKDAKVNFKVDQLWLAEKKLGPEQVSLFHYENGKWAELKTTIASQDGSYAYYSAETPGFSYFAIAQNMATAAPKTEVTPPALETTTTSGTTTTPVEKTSTPEVVEKQAKSTNWIWVLVGLVTVVLIAIVYELKKKSSKKSYY